MTERVRGGALCALLVAWGLLASLALATPPVLQVEAGPGMEGPAAGIRNADPNRFDLVMKIVGLDDAGSPILVLVAGEDSPLARRTPRWIAGYAVSDEDFVVLFPDRATSYPIDGMEELLRHEIAHVLVHRAAGRHEVPRWFNEGLATVAGDTWGWPDRSRFAMAMMRGERVSLDRTEQLFYEGPDEAARAYALAGEFVYDLLGREGEDTGARILSEVRRGTPFRDAFERVVGRSLGSVESEFWRRKTLWNRWIPWLTSSVFLWALITLLALWVLRVKRARDRLRLEQMELAEELAELRRYAPDDDEPVN